MLKSALNRQAHLCANARPRDQSVNSGMAKWAPRGQTTRAEFPSLAIALLSEWYAVGLWIGVLRATVKGAVGVVVIGLNLQHVPHDLRPQISDVPPARIVPMLADEGMYVASESNFSRVVRAEGQTAHRGRYKAPRKMRPSTTHIATAPRQVWCWDMTSLPANVAGRWFYLYLILDLYSCKIVGWEVHDRDHSGHAAHLVRRTAFAGGTTITIIFLRFPTTNLKTG